MLENDAYCNDILIQSAAVNAAVNAFNKELLANHIRTCVARDIRDGKDETIDELVATFAEANEVRYQLYSECVPACGGTNAQSSPSVSKQLYSKEEFIMEQYNVTGN